MNTTLLGFGIAYMAGAILLVFNIYFDITPTLPMKSLSVLAFFLPGVVALIAHLEIAKLNKRLDDIRERETDKQRV